jgi:hypothetical protein
MKAPGIIIIVGGMGALALLGLAALPHVEAASEPAPVSATDSRAPVAPRQPAQGSSPRLDVAPPERAQPAPAARPAPEALARSSIDASEDGRGFVRREPDNLIVH